MLAALVYGFGTFMLLDDYWPHSLAFQLLPTRLVLLIWPTILSLLTTCCLALFVQLLLLYVFFCLSYNLGIAWKAWEPVMLCTECQSDQIPRKEQVL